MQECSFSLTRDAFLDSHVNYLLLYLMLPGGVGRTMQGRSIFGLQKCS